MRMEHWWPDSDRGQLYYWDKNMIKSHLVHHKSHTQAWDRTQTSSLKQWWPTACNMAWPALLSLVIQKLQQALNPSILCPQITIPVPELFCYHYGYLQPMYESQHNYSHYPCCKQQLDHTTVISTSTETHTHLRQVTATLVPSDLPYCHKS